MNQLTPTLFIGGLADCRRGSARLAVVHACKYPCHVAAIGGTNVAPNQPFYLYRERTADLTLNMIDPPAPLFKPELFAAFLEFARRQLEAQRAILIHCNQGHSRAPALALVYLARVGHYIPDHSYAAAAQAFLRVCPTYQPGAGIRMYLEEHWGEIDG